MYKIVTLLLSLLISSLLFGEGTRELAPNGNITIDGNQTNDIAALHINSPEFNNFASYQDVNINSRLHIHISDPTNESILLGFSRGALNQTGSISFSVDFDFRIKDPNGNVIYNGSINALTREGIINGWSEGFNGPMQLDNAGGYNALEISSNQLRSGGFNAKGDYYIEFESPNADQFLIGYWDITVVNNSSGDMSEKKGRVWSYNWAFFAVNDFGFPERPFNGAFYVCAPDISNPEAAYITKIDFNGSEFRPAAFNIAFNSFGIENTGNITEDRKSFENGNRAIAEYAIFLNDPTDICITAELGELDFEGISRCERDDFCIQFVSSKEGQVEVLLDFEGNDGEFTPDSRDVILTIDVEPSQVGVSTCLTWDGIDGQGNHVDGSNTREVPISISFAQGIYHFPIYDAELLLNGFNIEAVRPAGEEPKLFYDDSNISVASGTGEPQVQLGGCALPCHTWSNYSAPNTIGFGNLNTINSWWFSQLTTRQEVFLLPSYYECVVTGPDQICENESAILNAELVLNPSNANTPDLLDTRWEGPSVIGNTSDLEVEVDQSGTYRFSATWQTDTDETCMTSCEKQIEILPVQESRIDTIIDEGTSIIINSETYDADGTYIQSLVAANGCDSILTIVVTVRFVDVDLSCEVVGPNNLCVGDSILLQVETEKSPPEANDPIIRDIEWIGTGIIGSTMGEQIMLDAPGDYSVTIEYENDRGEVKSTTCQAEISGLNNSFSQIDTAGFLGDTIIINDESYTSTGIYTQVVTADNGCDSTITIVVNITEPEYVCTIRGTSIICEGETAELFVDYSVIPSGANIPNYDNIEWQGPNLSNATGEVIEVSRSGIYTATLRWTDAIGESQSTTCDFEVEVRDNSAETIDVLIFQGDSVIINDETYDASGVYQQSLISDSGCDSTLTINVSVEDVVLYYDLNDCKSIDYSRFTSTQPNEISCADFFTSNIYRDNPSINAHSCTPGFDGVAMCVDALDDCEYQSGHEKSIIFEVFVEPKNGESVTLSGLSFYQKSPAFFEWIAGQTGPNNFPTLYGIRILKNDVEIYSQIDIETSFLWTKEDFVFLSIPEFTVDQSSVFRFELLPYCLIGRDVDVAVWDIDEVRIYAGCSEENSSKDILGYVVSSDGLPMSQVQLDLLSDHSDIYVASSTTDTEGAYAFDNVPSGLSYKIQAHNNRNHLDGVSTLDIVLIQRHILGMDIFSDPYDYIAADVNNTQSITAIDLIELRKLILGIYDEFPNNESWKFGNGGQAMDIYNPWFREDGGILISKDRETLDLVGVKIGDVNGDNELESRSSELINMEIKEINLGDNLRRYDFYIDQSIDLLGMQLQLEANGFMDMISENCAIMEGEYFYNKEESLLTISHTISSQITKSIDGLLFSIIASNIDKPSLHRLNNEVYILETEKIGLRNIKFDHVNNKSEIVWSVNPNPFSDVTYLNFKSEYSQKITLEIFDRIGRLLHTENSYANTGDNRLEISSRMIGKDSGVYYLKVRTGKESYLTKIVLL